MHLVIQVSPAESVAVRKDLLVQIFHNLFILEFFKLIVWNLETIEEKKKTILGQNKTPN